MFIYIDVDGRAMAQRPGRIHSTTVLEGGPGEIGPLYTRLLATDPGGPHRGDLYLTAEVYRDVGELGPVFPVYRSGDGLRWRQVGAAADTRFGAGNRLQPVLYELPETLAGLPRHTLLLAGNAVPSDLSETHLVIYASQDGGESWDFVSEVDRGGPATYDWTPAATTSAVWEPHLDLVDGRLVCHYADERHKASGMLQVLVHRSSTDLRTWSAPVLDFGVPDSFTRPGMFVSTGRMPDGVFRAVIEVVGPPEVPVHLVTSGDGEHWGDPEDLGVRLVADDGTALSGTPTIGWRQDGSGRVVVVALGRHSLDAEGREGNRALVSFTGGAGPWQSFELPTPAVRRLHGDSSGYSQSLLWNRNGDLVHATTVRNDRASHDIVVTVHPDDLAEVVGT